MKTVYGQTGFGMGWALLAVSIGCTPPGPPTAPAPGYRPNLTGADTTTPDAPTTPALVMKMRAVKMEGGAEVPFQINDALHTGQRIAYYVTTDQRAYVYVMQAMRNSVGFSLRLCDRNWRHAIRANQVK